MVLNALGQPQQDSLLLQALHQRMRRCVLACTLLDARYLPDGGDSILHKVKAGFQQERHGDCRASLEWCTKVSESTAVNAMLRMHASNNNASSPCRLMQCIEGDQLPPAQRHQS